MLIVISIGGYPETFVAVSPMQLDELMKCQQFEKKWNGNTYEWGRLPENSIKIDLVSEKDIISTDEKVIEVQEIMEENNRLQREVDKLRAIIENSPAVGGIKCQELSQID